MNLKYIIFAILSICFDTIAFAQVNKNVIFDDFCDFEEESTNDEDDDVPYWLDGNKEYRWIVTDELKLKLVNKAYPIKEQYYIHPDFPEYRVYLGGNYVIGYPYYITKQGQLERVLYDHDELCPIIWPAIMKYAYQNNVYNIQKESYGLQLWIKEKAGLNTNSELHKYKSWMKYAGQAYNYEEQIKLDCGIDNIYFYHFKRERLSNTEIIYMSENESIKIKIKYILKNGSLNKLLSIVSAPW